MIDPPVVPIIPELGGIDPLAVPVKAHSENQLTRPLYTSIELPSSFQI